MEEEDEEISFSVDLPEIAISPPSPRPSRKELQNNETTLDEDDNEILDEESASPGSHQEPKMPMIKITIESPVESMVEESPSSQPESPNEGLKRKRPPPISIPNSNFLNNFEIVTTVVTAENNENELSEKNITKDAMSKPDTSSVTRMSIGKCIFVTAPPFHTVIYATY